jgi:hypothetical protein
MKDCKEEWKVPVEPKKDRQPSEVEPSQNKSTPAMNTRETTRFMKKTRGSIEKRTLSQKKAIPKPIRQQKDHTNATNGETHREDNIPTEEG